MAKREGWLTGFAPWVASFVMIPLAMLGACCMWMLCTPLPVDWLVGVCLMSCGFIYSTSPVNWIPNSVPILGKLDDLIIGYGSMAFGAFCCYEADIANPIPRDAMHLGPLAVGAFFLLLSAISTSFKKTALGVMTMLLTPLVCFQYLEANVATGVILVVWGFIYLQLPWDLIPDSLPFIGKLDDIIFGWCFMLVGITILSMNRPESVHAMLHNAVARPTWTEYALKNDQMSQNSGMGVEL